MSHLKWLPTPLRTFCPTCLFLYGWGFVIKRDSYPVLTCLFCWIGCGTSSCNLSATLPLATSACRDYICGRFNNFVELSTHTLVLRHSGRHGCGRRIAGTVIKHSCFHFGWIWGRWLWRRVHPRTRVGGGARRRQVSWQIQQTGRQRRVLYQYRIFVLEFT